MIANISIVEVLWTLISFAAAVLSGVVLGAVRKVRAEDEFEELILRGDKRIALGRLGTQIAFTLVGLGLFILPPRATEEPAENVLFGILIAGQAILLANSLLDRRDNKRIRQLAAQRREQAANQKLRGMAQDVREAAQEARDKDGAQQVKTRLAQQLRGAQQDARGEDQEARGARQDSREGIANVRETELDDREQELEDGD